MDFFSAALRQVSLLQPNRNHKKRDNNVFLILMSWGAMFFIAFVLISPIRSSIVDWNIIPTESMNPTIVEGDQIFVNKLAYDLKLPFTYRPFYTWNAPHRGDIVVFMAPKKEILMIKRVVGLPGDLVSMRNNRLYINSKPITYEAVDVAEKDLLAPECDWGQRVLIENLSGHKHPIVLTPYQPSKNSFDPIAIPSEYYFMLGDNRDNSADSRYFGPVERWRILGRAAVVAASFNLKRDNRPRWKRFLTSLP